MRTPDTSSVFASGAAPLAGLEMHSQASFSLAATATQKHAKRRVSDLIRDALAQQTCRAEDQDQNKDDKHDGILPRDAAMR